MALHQRNNSTLILNPNNYPKVGFLIQIINKK